MAMALSTIVAEVEAAVDRRAQLCIAAEVDRRVQLAMNSDTTRSGMDRRATEGLKSEEFHIALDDRIKPRLGSWSLRLRGPLQV